MFERVEVLDVAQVYELWNEYAAAASEGDIERWLSLWIDDGIQMLPGAPRRVGKADIRRGMQPLFDLFVTRTALIEPEEVQILGDRAYSHGTYSLDMAPKEGGEPFRYSGQFLGILEKQADGSWKIAIDCRNCGTPPGCACVHLLRVRRPPGATVSQRKEGDAMDRRAPGFLTGCERLGMFQFSPTSGGAGERQSMPRRDLLL
jgi:uncharacterized protein (TIGR02246 family)